MTLPPCTVAANRLNIRYSLPVRVRESSPLREQVVAFKAWLTAPIQLDRDAAAISTRTLKNVMDNVFLFLGYCLIHQRIASPSFTDFLDLQLYSSYVAFQIAKGNGYNCIAHSLAHARRVCDFLARGSHSGMGERVMAIQSWMHRLRDQLSRFLARPRADVAQLEEEGAWVDAGTVVRVLESFRLKVLSTLPSFGDCNPTQAKQLHDACLANTMFGYLPPVRVSCLRRLQMPSSNACLDVDCRIPSCKGNRLEVKHDGLFMVLPHHKNQKR